jgi:hypothetical protein
LLDFVEVLADDEYDELLEAADGGVPRRHCNSPASTACGAHKACKVQNDK